VGGNQTEKPRKQMLKWGIIPYRKYESIDRRTESMHIAPLDHKNDTPSYGIFNACFNCANADGCILLIAALKDSPWIAAQVCRLSLTESSRDSWFIRSDNLIYSQNKQMHQFFLSYKYWNIPEWILHIAFIITNLPFSEFFTRNSALIRRCTGAHVTTVDKNIYK